METKKSIYDLELHETCAIIGSSVDGAATDDFAATRVAGGWIYHLWDLNTQTYVREVFIPFNNEFQK